MLHIKAVGAVEDFTPLVGSNPWLRGSSKVEYFFVVFGLLSPEFLMLSMKSAVLMSLCLLSTGGDEEVTCSRRGGNQRK